MKEIFYTKGHNFSKQNNEFPEQYKNKIINDDSLKILEKIPDNSVDLILTSPPYNYKIEYDVYNDKRDWKEYFNWLFKYLDEFIRVIKFGGRIVINIMPHTSDYVPTHHIISQYFMNKKMIWRGEIIWDKNNISKYRAFGSWKSPSSPYLKSTYEFLEIFSKGDIKHYGKKENIDITENEFKEYVLAKWSITPENKMKKYGHPAMFPEELVKRVLKLFTYKNDIVLDPFNGAGTTTYVAYKLNRIYLGIDISKKYCEIAEKRIHR